MIRLQTPATAGAPAAGDVDRAPLPTPSEIAEVLEDVASHPDFAAFEPGIGEAIFARVLHWLVQFWRRIANLVGDGSVAGSIVVLAAAVAVAAALAVVVRRARRRLRSPERGPDVPFETTPRTARDWLRAASARAAEGDLRRAASALYRGFLLTLEAAALVSFHASKTPGDYAAELAGRASTPRRKVADAFLDAFQDFSFGRAERTAAAYEGLVRLAGDAGCPVDSTDEGA